MSYLSSSVPKPGRHHKAFSAEWEMPTMAERCRRLVPSLFRTRHFRAGSALPRHWLLAVAAIETPPRSGRMTPPGKKQRPPLPTPAGAVGRRTASKTLNVKKRRSPDGSDPGSFSLGQHRVDAEAAGAGHEQQDEGGGGGH